MRAKMCTHQEISPLQRQILEIFKASPGKPFQTREIAEAVDRAGSKNIINTLGHLRMNLVLHRLPGRIQKVKGGANEQTTWTYHD